MSQPDPNITVSVPVTIGGYTGQRDAWQEHKKPMAVTIDSDILILESAYPGRTKVMVSWKTLQRAVSLVQQPQGPVTRPGGTARIGVIEPPYRGGGQNA